MGINSELQMKNLLNFFFSFDKLFKEKTVKLEPLLWIIVPLFALIKILFTLISVRIVAELAVAGYRINDNLSPDGGQSELADIDPVAEARKAAELAAARTREATRNITEKASEATKTMSETVQSKAKAATASVREKARPSSWIKKQNARGKKSDP